MSCQLPASRLASCASATTRARPTTTAINTRPAPFGAPGRARPGTPCQAGGFGSGNTASSSSSSSSKPKPRSKPRRVNIAKELGREPAGSGAAQSAKPDDQGSWFSVDTTLADFDKPVKAVILKTGRAIVLYKVGDEVYCSDANSTAYQFPLVDAKLLDLPGGPAVEVPLDGTQYDLRTGRVLKWCPTDSPMRAVLGTLKKASKPTDLPVYRTRVTDDGRIFVTLL